jgi:hypothetical protein
MTIKDATDRARLEADARRLGLAPNALEMSRAVGTDLIGAIVRDHVGRPSPVQPRGMLPEAPRDSNHASRPPVGTNGWIEPPSINDWRPPGLAVMDRMMDAQDALDRAERARLFNRLPLNGGK